MLTVRNVVKSHGTRRVLRDVSLSLECGQVGVLWGPSGSGKSTLLRCINGLEPFEQGHVVVGDVQLNAEPESRTRQRQLQALRRRVGMVFQQFNLFPHLSVLGNVIEAPIHVLQMAPEAATGSLMRLMASRRGTSAWLTTAVAPSRSVT